MEKNYRNELLIQVREVKRLKSREICKEDLQRQEEMLRQISLEIQSVKSEATDRSPLQRMESLDTTKEYVGKFHTHNTFCVYHRNVNRFCSSEETHTECISSTHKYFSKIQSHCKLLLLTRDSQNAPTFH